MTHKSIEDLPDEILLHIFGLLDGKVLKNSLEVCKRWNDLVSQSPSTMKNFVVRINSTSPEPEELLAIRKQFHSMSIEQNEIIYNRMILELFGAKLRQLKLKKMYIHCMAHFLSHTPLLEYLEVSQVTLLSVSSPSSQPHLKHLKVEESSDEILNMISDTSKLTAFEIGDFENREILVNFLMKNPTIESLSIGFKNLDTFFESEDVLNFPFRLKKLNFLGFPKIVASYENCLRKFIKVHFSTLEQIEIPHIIDNETSQIVFRLPLIKKLTYNVESLPTEKSFYCCMSPLKTITSLKLVGKFKNHEVAKLFISFFPNTTVLNLKHLKTSIWTMKFLQKITDSQKNIQHLMISNFFKGVSPNLQFQNLKSLFVYNSQHLQLLKNFILTNSSLEEITIDKIHEEGKMKMSDVEDIISLPSLTRLSVRGEKKIIDEIWSWIKYDYKQLKELNLRIFNPRNFTLSDDRRIIFPHDKEFWFPEKCDTEIC